MGRFSMLLILSFLLIVGVPVFLNWIIFFRRFRNGWFLLAWLVFTIAFVLTDIFVAPWHWWSYWALFSIIAATFLGVIVSLRKFSRVKWERPSPLLFMATSFMLVGAGYFMIFLFTVFNATLQPANTVQLSAPLRGGTYAVIQGGAGKPLQAGHSRIPSQRFAVDVTVINELGISSSTYLAPTSAGGIAMGTPVYSPCDGQVVMRRDGLPDGQRSDDDTPLGNKVVVNCDGVLVTLAHLQNGSIQVQNRESVTRFKVIGRVGFSGHATEPYLHIHAERGDYQGDASNNPGVPAAFNGKFLWKGRVYSN